MALTWDDMDDFRYLAAHHEAGHAEAAVILGGWVSEIYVHYEYGYTRHDGDSDRRMVYYAGSWAEVRALREMQEMDRSGLDAAGRDFKRQVLALLAQKNGSDWVRYERECHHDVRELVGKANWAYLNDLPFDESIVTVPDETWDDELEELWPKIKHLAYRLYRDEQVINVGTTELFKVGTDCWQSATRRDDPAISVCCLEPEDDDL